MKRFLAVVTLLVGSWSSIGLALNCQQVRQLTVLYLKYHYSFETFNDELSQRTLGQMVKSWDPGKLYFYQKDVEGFEEKYGNKLDDMIAKGDCSAISNIVNVYSQRFEERHRLVPKLINQKFDFSKDEYMSIDRKKNAYAKTKEDLDERWRKRIKFQVLQLKNSLDDMKKVQDKLSKRYQLVVKRHNEQTIDQVYSTFLNAFSSSLDPHSEYLSAEALEDFRIDTKLSLEGIGAVLRTEDGFTVIQSLVPGGAASKTTKIKVDDKIIAVAQGEGDPVDVIDMQLREVVKLIRGTAGTEVRLTLLRKVGDESKKFIVPVIREKIQLEDRVAKSKVYQINVDDPKAKGKKTYKIGVLDLPSFYVDFQGMHERTKDYRSSYRDTKRELAKLEKDGVDAVIVDLRSNGGGSLEESIKIGGLFFDQGPVVQIKDMEGRTQAHSDPYKGTEYSGPLLLMINRQSASASEILAGAIQDYERGIIVGDSHSFGKGTVQNLNDIGDRLGAVKITISKFYRPSGSSTQLKGVSSDIVLPGLIDELEIGEKHYDHALIWDTIKKAEYQTFNLTSPYVEPLRKASEERTKTDPGFLKVAEDIKEYRDGEKDRYRVSLKEEKEDKSKKDEEKTASERDKREEPTLEDDISLQETLRVAADYVRLLNKMPLARVTLPALKKPIVADAKKKASAKDPEAKVKGAKDGSDESMKMH